MPNIPPLITHTPNVQPLYAASGGVQVSTDNPYRIIGVDSTPINLATGLGLTFTVGKTYVMQVEFAIHADPPITANSTDALVVAVQSGGGIIGRSLLVPLWALGTATEPLAFTCMFQCLSASSVLMSFGSGGYELVNTYTLTVESIQLAELGST
jgi:hypothetical protein